MPVFATIGAVELLEVGTWDLSSGPATFTTADLQAAVDAMACPAVREPVLKLGHVDPRFDGEPAIGKAANLRVSDNGMTLLADFTGMPDWLGQVMATAYPTRSVEGTFGFTCGVGHKHPFVLTAVALLGTSTPGVSTLDDIAALFDIAATGRPVHIPSPGGPMPQPVHAAVAVEDVRRGYYDSLGAAQQWWWIRVINVDPAEVIVDDDDGALYRVPYTADGDTVTFGEAVPVVVDYRDKVAASTAPRAVYASRESSRPTSPTPHAGGPVSTKGTGMDPAKLREALGLSAEASDIEVQAALAVAGLTTPTAATDTPVTPPAPALIVVPPAAPVALPEGYVVVPEERLQALEVAASRGVQAAETQRVTERTRYLGDAVRAGKLIPARLSHFEALYDRDETGTREFIDSVAAGAAVPTSEVGHANVTLPADDDAAFAAQMAQLGSSIFSSPKGA